MCVDRPVLSLDRPFTYQLDAELGAGIGSLVSVPFHGRSTRGWILGPTDDVPARILPIKKVYSDVRFFDAAMLRLLREVSERFVAPLAAVISRAVPPRVASEEAPTPARVTTHMGGRPGVRTGDPDSPLASYRNGPELLESIGSGGGVFLVRPAPRDEASVIVEAVRVCLERGRRAIVAVPEAEPVPYTAEAVLDAFGDRSVPFLGGDNRERYRTWLSLQAGRHDVVVGTRPAVFAPLDVGLVVVSRESHANLREDRVPRYHARDVACMRSRLQGATAMLCAFCPSADSMSLEAVEVSPLLRSWPPVEVAKPGPEGRSPRLASALRPAGSAFLFEPFAGYGVARVCKKCGEPAACAQCGGLLRQQAGSVRCSVCEAPGVCAACGSTDFGIARGGVERVAEWARNAGPSVPVTALTDEHPGPPLGDEISIGTAASVRDFGPISLELVGILDADAGLRRAGLAARERALSIWMEAASWGERVIVQTRNPGDAAVQSLVSGNPQRFFRSELARRSEAGFPAGAAVFRVAGKAGIETEIERHRPFTLLSNSLEDETVCLVALPPDAVASFGKDMRRAAAEARVSRVDAEPHL